MKKKLLIVLTLLCIFVCLFALTVSAEEKNQYVEFKVILDGDTEYTTVYTTNSHDTWNPGITMSYDFYTDAERTTVLDKTKIVRIDLANTVVHTLDATAAPVRKSSITRLVGDGSNPLTKVTHIYLPNTVSDVPSNMCKGWTSLISVDFGGAIKISDSAFENCTFTEFTVPEQITQINNNAFKGCAELKSLAFEGDIPTIGSAIFENCTSLTDINLANLTTIGGSMFKGCTGLTEITIPDAVTSLGASAFQDCSNLETVNISANSQISNRWISVFRGCTKLESIFIPPLVTDLGYDNFWDCKALTEIIFSEGLEKISSGNNFANCEKLTHITLPNSVKTVASGNITHYVKEIRFGNSLETLGDGALTSKALERVYLPASLTTLGARLLGYSNPADSSSNITFIFTGTKAQAEALQAMLKEYTETNASSHAPNSSKFYDATLVSADDYDADTTEPSGYHFVYDYNVCKAFYENEHILLEENAVIDFADADYFSAYNKCIACTREGCDVTNVEEICGALFTSKGYSKSGSDIVFGIVANTDAIADYNLKTGNNVKYGIVVSQKYNNGDLINAEGKIQSNSILNAEFTGTSYTLLQIKITGISSDNYATELHCCGYIVDGTGVTYLYEKDKKPAVGSSANVIAHNTID